MEILATLDETQRLTFIKILAKLTAVDGHIDEIEKDLFNMILSFCLDSFSYDDELDYELLSTIFSLIQREQYKEMIIHELNENHPEIIDKIINYDEIENKNSMKIAFDIKTIIEEYQGDKE